MLPLIESIHNIYVPVRNLAQSKRWYQERLGLELIRETTDTADFQVYQGDTQLTLVQLNDFNPIQYLDQNHLTPYYNFNTLDAEKCHLRLQTFDVPVTNIMELEMLKCFNLLDPDENVIGVCYEKEGSPYFEPTEELWPPLFERVEAVFIPVTDLNRAIHWYTHCLGLKLLTNWKEGADLGLNSGQTLITLLRMNDFKPIRPLSRSIGKCYFSFKTQDIQKAHSYLKHRVDVSNIGETGIFAYCQLYDSEGNSLELVSLKVDSEAKVPHSIK